MQKKITQLTDEQKAQFAAYVTRWTDIGLSTQPADRKRAEAGIAMAYEAAGLKPPRVVWTTSPLASGLTRATLKLLNDKASVRDSVWASVGASVGASVRDSVWDSVWDSVGASVWASVGASVGDSVRDSVRASVWASVRASVWASVGASVWASVWASVGASVWASVRDSVGASVWASVGASVWASVWASVGASVWASVRDSVRDSVWASVRDSVRASVWDSVRDSVGASVWDSVRDSVGASVRDSVGDSVRDSAYGQHDADWLSFYSFFREVTNLTKETDPLRGLFEISQSAGWFLPHEHVCWISERHNTLNRDERGRLHNLAGPALAYPDGFSIYAVHGVRLPSHIIEQPESITVDAINDERNAEIRRVMIEKYGTDRYLLDSGASVVHQDTDQYGRLRALYRREFRDDEPLVMVRVTNSTPEPTGEFKEYFLRVPPHTQTCGGAIAWTFGMPADEYEPLVES